MALNAGIVSGKRDITVQKGATFEEVITFTSQTLEDFTARMQIRNSKISTDSVISLTEGSGITIVDDLASSGDGTVTVRIEAAATAALSIQKGFYDIEMVNETNSDVIRILEGEVIITEEVTK